MGQVRRLPRPYLRNKLSALAGDHPNGAPYEWGLKLPLPGDFVRPVRLRSRLLLTSPSTESAVSGAMNLGLAGRPHVVEVFIEAPGASGSIADKQQPRHWRALRITQDKPETDLLSSSRGSRIRRSLELMSGG